MKVWIYNTTFASSGGRTSKSTCAILSALGNFKASAASVVADPTGGAGLRFVMGPYGVYALIHALIQLHGHIGTVQSVPSGYTSSYGIVFSNQGINAATSDWGALLVDAYNTSRIPPSRDVLNGKLSFWTDNGAVCVCMRMWHVFTKFV